jgi:AcrR family transcriptional regulator
MRQTLNVSPRPSPTRHDAVAMVYLNAAAQLIDASLTAQPETNPPRLRTIHYPAALDWIRIEDVLRLAHEAGHSASKRALLNRWPTKDDFIRDAVLHAMLYRDDPARDPILEVQTVRSISRATSFSAGVTDVVDNFLNVLLSDPRSFLLAHISPLLARHSELAADIDEGNGAGVQIWSAMYRQVLDGLGLRLRPDWSIERLADAIRLVIDGTVVRSRLSPSEPAMNRWTRASIYADTVLAIAGSCIDADGDGKTLADWLDERVKSRSTTADA